MAMKKTTNELMQKLRENYKHPLWLKPIKKWTDSEIKKLYDPSYIEPNSGKVVRNRQPVAVTMDGEVFEFPSIRDASNDLKISYNMLNSRLKGRVKQLGFTIIRLEREKK